MKHLQGIQAYKKAVIKAMQEGTKELMSKRAQALAEAQAQEQR